MPTPSADDGPNAAPELVSNVMPLPLPTSIPPPTTDPTQYATVGALAGVPGENQGTLRRGSPHIGTRISKGAGTHRASKSRCSERRFLARTLRVFGHLRPRGPSLPSFCLRVPVTCRTLHNREDPSEQPRGVQVRCRAFSPGTGFSRAQQLAERRAGNPAPRTVSRSGVESGRTDRILQTLPGKSRIRPVVPRKSTLPGTYSSDIFTATLSDAYWTSSLLGEDPDNLGYLCAPVNGTAVSVCSIVRAGALCVAKKTKRLQPL